jgi:hypothetical protein
MVLPASDSLQAGFGFEGDATHLMPDFADEVMPEGGDINALPDDVFTDEAATESADAGFSIDALSPEQRAVLDAHYEQTYGQKFEQDKRTLQQTLENQNQSLRRDSSRLAADMAAQQAWFQNYLQRAAAGEINPDPRDFAVMQQQLQQQRVQHEQQAAQQYQGFESWARGSIERMQQFVTQQATGDDGVQLFDPNDGELVGMAKTMYQLASVAHRPGATEAQVEAYRNAYEAHRMKVVQKREQGIRETLSGKRRNAAQTQQAARSRQQQRGRQDTSRGGAAGGAPNLTSMIAAVQQELAGGRVLSAHEQAALYGQAHEIALQRMSAARA